MLIEEAGGFPHPTQTQSSGAEGKGSPGPRCGKTHLHFTESSVLSLATVYELLRFISTHMGVCYSKMVLEKQQNCSESKPITYKMRLHGGLNTQASSEQTCLSWFVGPSHVALESADP